MIQDLNSSGGTYLNGVRLAALNETQVVIGDRIALAAELELVVVSHEASILSDARGMPTAIEIDAANSSLILGKNGEADDLECCRLAELTPAERHVACWVSRGVTTLEDIGKKLFRSPETVRTQMNSIYRKLNVHSREALLALLIHRQISWAISRNVSVDEDSVDEDSGNSTSGDSATVVE